jgi:hypothetical protein
MPSVKGADGKAEQRKRNAEAGNKTRSGSSGVGVATSKMPSRLWEEVEGDVKHLTDIAGRISHSQVGSAGQMIATISVPLEFAHDLLDVHLKASDGMVYMRMYYVSLADYMGDMECAVCDGHGVTELEEDHTEKCVECGGTGTTHG